MKINHPSVKKLKQTLWHEFSRYIRLRDCLKTTGTKTTGKCICCGRLVKINGCDAGHFVSRRFNSTLFDEKNVNLECKNCNAFPDATVFDNYRKNLIKKYGEGTDIELEDMATESRKFQPYDLENMIKEYKKKIKKLEAI
jgi:hypothetical protein